MRWIKNAPPPYRGGLLAKGTHKRPSPCAGTIADCSAPDGCRVTMGGRSENADRPFTIPYRVKPKILAGAPTAANPYRRAAILFELYLTGSEVPGHMAWSNIAKTEYYGVTKAARKGCRKRALIHVKHWSNFKRNSALQ